MAKSSKGELTVRPDRITVSSTEAKNEFGRVIDAAQAGNHVVVTRHGRPTVVILSVAEHEALSRTGAPDLSRLEEEFDLLYDALQRPGAAKALRDALGADPSEFGKAARAAARHPVKDD